MVTVKGRIRNVGDVIIMDKNDYDRLPRGIKAKIIYS